MNTKKKVSFKQYLRRILIAAMMILLIPGLLGGCGSGKAADYKAYVQSLIDATYLGEFEGYAKATGSGQSDAEALYKASAYRLAKNLCAYYELDIESDSQLIERAVEIAKTIYRKTKVELSEVRQENSEYYIDVTISPMNILNGMEERMKAYVEDYSRRIDAGEFNDIEKDEYSRRFATGLLDLLTEGINEMTYLDPVTITVMIHRGNGTYYISDTDFKTIDSLIIATSGK